MIIYVFGNPDHQQDSIALTVMGELKKIFPDVEFITIPPNQDLPFENHENVILMDAVAGINQVTLIEDQHIAKLLTPPRNTVHDFDLGFQLKYLKKLGKLGNVTIIGLPLSGKFTLEEVTKLIKSIQ